uniref:Myosin heavy chain 1 [Tribolium castaneum] n=2 Tax=Lepeophtheirus salmonis TaxID=72036 RepID=A0A0K2TA41_LEPSM
MPGHVKLGKSNEPDPDPMPYLVVSNEMRRNDMHKPYDAKKSVWVPDLEGGYCEALLDSEEGGKSTVMIGHIKKVYKTDEVAQVNPPKFEKCDDMANLTFLNDASVLWNLRNRYTSKLIYTYSGLFCVVVNPYKRFPIYTQSVVKIYLGKRRNEVPPHLWAITETAYRNMLTNTKDQSMLITGESGAGKTENTKKVISYLAMVASSGKKQTRKTTLEDQIVATNPILESYGNAKTSRNDNSSRFGKFIRIHFNSSGKLSGCDIESYLLEKSRITQQQEVERSYHIFYQLLMPTVPNMIEKCNLTDDIYDYSFVSQGKVKVESIDDNEEMEFTDNAFDVLGFTEEEKWNCYKITAAVMSFGEVSFKQKGRDDQAECDELIYPNKISNLFGVSCDQMMKAFIKPKIKVGTEWVTKGQNVEQATNAVGGIARACYQRLFNWLIEMCNKTLIDSSLKKTNFVAVLDIAGFEIFEFNGFEQISINFVNEKLQQFFNHHMFVVEQEEYIREGIDWVMVDFGMDLAACILMFEKPMGIWAILEEESLFPKATDKSFEEKLKATHLGKSSTFAKPQSKTDKNAHFAIIHYAGIVSYNVTNWLEKNKDPLNDTVVDVLKHANNALLVHLWRDHPGQTYPPEETKGKKKKKGGSTKTVSSVYLVQLNDLMNTLHSTEPHFIRCIVPNTHKQAGMIEQPLVMHQLTCNGVLEGIRICMRGFPNRITYKDYKSRYFILGANELKKASDQKTGVLNLMENIKFDKTKYKLGHTKVFFRAGALALLEEMRDTIVVRLIRWLQARFYGSLARKKYDKKAEQRKLLIVIQRNFRKFMQLRNWGWFIIIQKTRPLIGQINIEEELKALESKAKEAYGAYQEQLDTKKKLEAESEKIKDETKTMLQQLSKEQGNLSEFHEKQAKISAQKADLEVQLNEAIDLLNKHEQERLQATQNKKSLEAENSGIKREIDDLHSVVSKLEQEKTSRDHQIRMLNDDITNQDEIINKLNKDKRYLSDNKSKANEELQTAQDKVEHLNMIKVKLEQTRYELDDSLEREKRSRAEIEKSRRKVEGELKITQGTVLELERQKKELENSIARRESEINHLASKLDDEQVGVTKYTRNIKEVQCRVEEMEEELEAERQARAKAERQRSDLARELEEMGERLEEAGGATSAQIELNKKRESEVSKLRKDLEECHIQQEATMMNLKKRHQDAVFEMTEQIEQLSKMKSKIDKDKITITQEISDVNSGLDEITRSKASAEKSNKQLLDQLNDITKRVDESKLTIHDYENSKRKLLSENSDHLRQLQELESNYQMLAKIKVQLAHQLEEAKMYGDDEAKERSSLLAKFRNLEHEIDGMRDHYEEEKANKSELNRQYCKAQSELDSWRCKFETEALAKAEELEMSKMKLQARLAEAQGTIENLNGKYSMLDKSKIKLSTDLEEAIINLDQAQVLNSQMEKKAKSFDKIVKEWKTKADNFSMDLDNSQKECRNSSSELFRVKSAFEECVLQLDEVRKENKNLSSEIKDIMDQISEGGRSIHEIDKIRRRLEVEKQELTSALEEAECALEQEENKVLRTQIELTQVRQEIERRLQEKEEEFGAIKKNFGKAIEQLQTSLEAESKYKAEAFRMKKKLEADITELEVALEHANAANMESQRTIKKYQNMIREAQMKFEDEQSAKNDAKEVQLEAERRSNASQNALEEAKTLLEQSDRHRRQFEQELCDTNEVLSDLTVQNQSLEASKRKFEGEISSLSGEMDDMQSEARMSDEKATRSMMDAAKIADELRNEQDISIRLEKDRKYLESVAKDFQNKLDEAEQNALKSGKKAMGKMESRIRELESELDTEQRRLGDSMKNFRKSERKIKELTYSCDEDRKNHERMQVLVDQLQSKVRSYKKQIEEAEEIAAINLAKFKQTQNNLNESFERADINEQALAKYKARERAASLAPL